jgi:hypothetical protein
LAWSIPLNQDSVVKGLASASTLVSPASSEAKHYRDIVSSVQGLAACTVSVLSFCGNKIAPQKRNALRLAVFLQGSLIFNFGANQHPIAPKCDKTPHYFFIPERS